MLEYPISERPKCCAVVQADVAGKSRLAREEDRGAVDGECAGCCREWPAGDSADLSGAAERQAGYRERDDRWSRERCSSAADRRELGNYDRGAEAEGKQK